MTGWLQPLVSCVVTSRSTLAAVPVRDFGHP
jgi:hypothetical protein